MVGLVWVRASVIAFLLLLKCVSKLETSEKIPEDVKWCDIEEEYCGRQPHVACDRYHFSESIFYNRIIEIDSEQKNKFLTIHNAIRNVTASGAHEGYPSASRMMELQWDDTLAFLAESYNRKKSLFESYNFCFATNKWTNVGKNHFHVYFYWKDIKNSYTNLIEYAVLSWAYYGFIANKNYTQLNAKSTNYTIPTEKTNKEFALTTMPFLNIIMEKTDRIGCSLKLIPFREDSLQILQVVCLYSDSALESSATFRAGTPCSECASFGAQCSKNWTNLCAEISDDSFISKTTQITILIFTVIYIINICTY